MTNVNIQVCRNSNGKGAIFLIGCLQLPIRTKQHQRRTTFLQQPHNRICEIVLLRGSLRQARLGIVWDCSPSWPRAPPLSPQVRRVGWWVSPPPSSRWYKNDLPRDPGPSSSLLLPGRMADSPSLNKAVLPHPTHVLCLDSSTWNARTKIWKHHLRITILRCSHLSIPTSLRWQARATKPHCWLRWGLNELFA
jgi:hypothetical protein